MTSRPPPRGRGKAQVVCTISTSILALRETLAGTDPSRRPVIVPNPTLPTTKRSALAEARECVPSDYLYMQTGLSLATGWALAASGSLTEAIATVQAGAAEARDRGQPTHELALLQAAAQWGDASGATRARELADLLALPLANAVAGHTESLPTGNGDGLLDASAKYRAIGDRATAADAAAQAAVAFASGLQGKRGRYAAALAQELSEQCGGLCTPALRTPVSSLPLTGRQREIAELVAAGLSNRDIGDRLMMSVRTVEGHLLRACKRVGAGSRSELTEAHARRAWRHRKLNRRPIS